MVHDDKGDRQMGDERRERGRRKGLKEGPDKWKEECKNGENGSEIYILLVHSRDPSTKRGDFRRKSDFRL